MGSSLSQSGEEGGGQMVAERRWPRLIFSKSGISQICYKS